MKVKPISITKKIKTPEIPKLDLISILKSFNIMDVNGMSEATANSLRLFGIKSFGDLHIFYEEQMIKYESERRRRRLARKNASESVRAIVVAGPMVNGKSKAAKYANEGSNLGGGRRGNEKAAESKQQRRRDEKNGRKSPTTIDKDSTTGLVEDSTVHGPSEIADATSSSSSQSSLTFQSRPGYLREAVNPFGRRFRSLLGESFAASDEQAIAVERQLRLAHVQAAIDTNHRVHQVLYDYGNPDSTGVRYEQALARNCARPYSVYTLHDDYMPAGRGELAAIAANTARMDCVNNASEITEDRGVCGEDGDEEEEEDDQKDSSIKAEILHQEQLGSGVAEDSSEELTQVLEEVSSTVRESERMVNERSYRENKVKLKSANYVIPVIKLSDGKKEKWSNIID